MIARYDETIKNKVLEIWLQAPLQAHDFVNAEYWYKMQNTVGEYYLPYSNSFVFVDKHQIKGFISVTDGKHIGALFVKPQFQKQKIGRKLLKFVQRRYPLLSLNVFGKNLKAIDFYLQNGFKIIGEQIEPSTKEKELNMAWSMACKSGYHKRYATDS